MKSAVGFRSTVPVSRIARRLTRITLLASGAALVLACLILMTYDFTTFRTSLRVQREVLTEIVGLNTEDALVLDDAQAAERTLATLRAAPRIETAGLYTPDGRLFAAYRRDPEVESMALPASPSGANVWSDFDGLRYMHVVRRMRVGTSPLGVVYIRTDMLDLRQRLVGYALITTAVLLVSLLVAQLVSRVSRRAISEPIAALATAASRISADRDYSIRVTANGEDELAVLIAMFNEMLSQIQDRDRALRDSNDLLEHRVQERTAALHESNTELEAFCYSVSHDLRSPLRAIDGFSAALLEDLDGKLDDTSTKHLARVRAATQRMGALIDDLLDLSRIARSEMTFNPVDLSAIARLVMADRRAADPGRTVSVDIQDDVKAFGDARLLRQVLENLLGNAWKFTSKQAEPHIEFGASTAGGETVHFVKDNGAGYDPAYADKLFGVFQRLHSMTEYPGTGVGLAIVDRVVRRHGGRVWGEAAVGRGATFFFTLSPHPSQADEPRRREQMAGP